MTTDCWRLDSFAQTLVLAGSGGRLPCVVYWGAPLPKACDLSSIAAAEARDVTGGMLDANPALSICPEADRGFPGQPGLALRDAEGRVLRPRLRLLEVEAGENALTVKAGDDEIGLRYVARFAIDAETHVLTLSAEIESDAPVMLDWLAAPVLPAPQLSDEMIDVSGRWIGEFRLQRTPWSAGIRMREARTGRSGHEHFPGLIVPGRGATNTAGAAYGFHYGWSGGHRMVAEELPDGRRQVQFGHASGTELAPLTRAATAPLLVTFSRAGLNGCATAFQRHIRDRIVQWPAPERPRPVHYNCWEAVYFDHDVAELKEIATRASALGAERFVLDDGWFGRRDDDTTSLGDWWIDERKYPDGLAPLIDHVHDLGMSFGIWFEPEMINAESETFRAHPDWALGPMDQIEGRQQRVLDLANEAVRDYLFDRIGAVLRDHAVDYVKWDHNRLLPYPDAAQTRGVYDLLDRLRAAHPKVEIESCASGGGRIDAGILARTQRVWLSDSNDAVERLRIQHEAALFLPAAITGSHVGPRRCHTSGRVLSMPMRAWVAAQRHMGFEMDPRELTEDEAQALTRVTAWWKANRDWMMRAEIHRLDSADDAIIAEAQIAEAGARFVVFAGRAGTSPQILPRPLPLTGLEPDALYRLELVNGQDIGPASRGDVALARGAVELPGAYLMSHGIQLPAAFPETIWVIEGRRI
ncbi:alpha-galactosidase [Limimaricola cinnabarinus]|uniref:alpha-galactosidase n=1 Tax=Limimaricola cinnabarinus TaxID=1125964 RepID=A0A2G1MCL4_9RHOB|nr:alpha-galactosidase [Limimaricola cinnabarinus]PHP26402.1 alpha-galactosidase [Limimaricola cinnabarinus]